MIVRYALSVTMGAVVTFGLLFLMQLMIATGRGAVTDAPRARIVDFVRVERNELVELRERKPERLPEPEPRPDLPAPDRATDFDGALAVSTTGPAIQSDLRAAGLGFGVADGEYLPIVKVAPVYPARALARKLEGYVMVEFTVTKTGTVKDVVVLESTADLFERPAVEAALKFKYKPRVIDGEPVEVAGVKNKLVFEMERTASTTTR
jgi:protein TonB